MNMCDGCAAAGDTTPATQSVETWDEGDGWITLHYCDECHDGLEAVCDRCGEPVRQPGLGVCDSCAADYSRGDSY